MFIKASIARFYGWNDKEISEMPYGTFMSYFKAMDVVKAAEGIESCKYNSYPHFDKKEDREKILKDLNSRLRNIEHNSANKDLTPSQMAEIMARRMTEIKNRV